MTSSCVTSLTDRAGQFLGGRTFDLVSKLYANFTHAQAHPHYFWPCQFWGGGRTFDLVSELYANFTHAQAHPHYFWPASRPAIIRPPPGSVDRRRLYRHQDRRRLGMGEWHLRTGPNMIIRPSNQLYQYFILECIYLCVGKASSLPTVISQCGEVDKA